MIGSDARYYRESAAHRPLTGLSVDISLSDEGRFRLWLGEKLLRLAFWVCGGKVRRVSVEG